MRYQVGSIDDFPVGGRRIVEVESRTIGIFNVDGRLHAVRNVCPHHGAPLCRGTLSGTMLPSDPGEYHFGMQDQVLRCPWHGWEFDLTTGRCLFGVDKTRVAATYDIEVDEDGQVFIDMKRRRL